MSAWRGAYPKEGDRVRGRHILGADYVGTVWQSRAHTMEPARTVVFIRFDGVTRIAEGDSRTDICTEVYPPEMAGDTRWQDTHGAWFEILAPIGPGAEGAAGRLAAPSNGTGDEAAKAAAFEDQQDEEHAPASDF